MTNQVTWRSVDVNLATINSAGLATAISCPVPGGGCETSITATALSTSGASIPSDNVSALTINLNPANLPSLTVYPVGLGTGSVTSSPVGINCPGAVTTPGAGCTGNFILNAGVTLTAVPGRGVRRRNSSVRE